MVWLVFIAVLICMGAFLFYASYSIRSGVYVKALCRGNTDKRVGLPDLRRRSRSPIYAAGTRCTEKVSGAGSLFLHRGEGTGKSCRNETHRIGGTSRRKSF